MEKDAVQNQKSLKNVDKFTLLICRIFRGYLLSLKVCVQQLFIECQWGTFDALSVNFLKMGTFGRKRLTADSDLSAVKRQVFFIISM